MARSVADAAFMLSVMAGADARDPASYPIDPARSPSRSAAITPACAIAWCLDLGGLPLDPRVRAVLEPQRHTFEDLGCIVEDAASGSGRRRRHLPDAADVGELEHARPAADAPSRRDQARGDLGHRVGRAADRRRHRPRDHRATASCWSGCAGSRRSYEFLVCAVNQVPPFDASLDWPKEIDGVAMENYVRVDEIRVLDFDDAAVRRSRCRPVSPPTVCRSASRSSAAIATISACCRSPTPSNRRRASVSAVLRATKPLRNEEYVPEGRPLGSGVRRSRRESPRVAGPRCDRESATGVPGLPARSGHR